MDVAYLLLLAPAWRGACTTKFGAIKLRHIIVLLTASPPGGTLPGHTQTKGFFTRDPERKTFKGSHDLLFIKLSPLNSLCVVGESYFPSLILDGQ